MSDYEAGQAVGINPSLYKQSDTAREDGFAALVKVVSSRYGKLEYGGGYDPKLAIVWTLVSSSGTEFKKTFSTGLPWDGPAYPSPDSRKLIVKNSTDFNGLRPNSDAVFLLQKAVQAGYPADKLADDIGVFDGHCFFIATTVNPNSKGSSAKPYPKRYHPEGYEAARAEYNAKKAAQGGGVAPQATMSGSYAPPPVVVAGEVITKAAAVLGELLALNGGTITRNQIPAKLHEIASTKGWTTEERQNYTVALWDVTSLGAVVQAASSTIKQEGETLSLK